MNRYYRYLVSHSNAIGKIICDAHFYIEIRPDKNGVNRYYLHQMEESIRISKEHAEHYIASNLYRSDYDSVI